MTDGFQATLRIWRSRSFGLEGLGLIVAGGGIVAREWWIAALGLAGVLIAGWQKASGEASKPPPAPPPPGPPPPRTDLLPRLNALDVDAERWLEKLARHDAGNRTSLALTWSSEAERWFELEGLSGYAAIRAPIVKQARTDYGQPRSDAEHIADVRLTVERVRERVRLARESIEAQILGR